MSAAYWSDRVKWIVILIPMLCQSF
jgi:hypothetical protein